jgi:tetratricopeptide (TPR) repeat protein
MLAQMEAELTSGERAARDEQTEKSAAADRLVPLEQATEDLRFLLRANRDAMVQWKNHDEDAARHSWTTLYRRYVETGRPNSIDDFTSPWEEIAQLLGRPLELKRARSDAWIEIMNNLGFALWTQHEFHQAKGAYLECAALVAASGRPRPVVELNLGDVERDLGHVAEARAHYEAFLKTDVPVAQKSRVAEELKRLADTRRSR